MPGILPSLANSLKQMRQRSKSLMYDRLLPHLKQRETVRVENLGFFFDLAMTDVLAIYPELLKGKSNQKGVKPSRELNITSGQIQGFWNIKREASFPTPRL